MRVAYVTIYDSQDRSQWSGSGFAIQQALIQQGIEVVPVSPLVMEYPWLGWLKKAFYRGLFQRRFMYDRSERVGRGYARQVKTMLGDGQYDAVVAPGIVQVSYLDCPQPIVVWTDATFESYMTGYDFAKTTSAESMRAGHRMERHGFARAALMIFASDWAAESAIRDYGVDPAKVKVVPFGSNFVNPPSKDAALAGVAARPRDCCRLITVGVDWFRKGVPRAIELASLLNARGLRTELDIVGCAPPPGVTLPDFVHVAGFIDKRAPDGERKMSELFLRSHFHVLLASAEAFGVVFAEANAHALPNIASDVGGIPSAVVNGRGGQRFALDRPIGDIADYIEALMRDPARYAALAARARDEYDERLNWRVSGALARSYIEAIL